MSNDDSRKYALIIAAIMIILCAIWIYYSGRKQKQELSNGAYVKAHIVQKERGRSITMIYVEYKYHNKTYQSDFTTTEDTFQVHEEVILKVSRSDPEGYLKFICKVR